jgi:hypothetical protein
MRSTLGEMKRSRKAAFGGCLLSPGGRGQVRPDAAARLSCLGSCSAPLPGVRPISRALTSSWCRRSICRVQWPTSNRKTWPASSESAANKEGEAQSVCRKEVGKDRKHEMRLRSRAPKYTSADGPRPPQQPNQHPRSLWCLRLWFRELSVYESTCILEGGLGRCIIPIGSPI